MGPAVAMLKTGDTPLIWTYLKNMGMAQVCPGFWPMGGAKWKTLLGYRWVWKTGISWRAVCFELSTWLWNQEIRLAVLPVDFHSNLPICCEFFTRRYSSILQDCVDFRWFLCFLPAGKRSQTWHQVRLCPRWKGRNGLVGVSGRNDEWYLRRMYSTGGGWIHQWHS